MDIETFLRASRLPFMSFFYSCAGSRGFPISHVGCSIVSIGLNLNEVGINKLGVGSLNMQVRLNKHFGCNEKHIFRTSSAGRPDLRPKKSEHVSCAAIKFSITQINVSKTNGCFIICTNTNNKYTSTAKNTY